MWAPAVEFAAGWMYSSEVGIGVATTGWRSEGIVGGCIAGGEGHAVAVLQQLS